MHYSLSVTIPLSLDDGINFDLTSNQKGAGFLSECFRFKSFELSVRTAACSPIQKVYFNLVRDTFRVRNPVFFLKSSNLVLVSFDFAFCPAIRMKMKNTESPNVSPATQSLTYALSTTFFDRILGKTMRVYHL